MKIQFREENNGQFTSNKTFHEVAENVLVHLKTLVHQLYIKLSLILLLLLYKFLKAKNSSC